MLFARYASYEEQKKCAKFAIDLGFFSKDFTESFMCSCSFSSQEHNLSGKML